LVDRLRSKRALVAVGIVALAVGALLTALVPTFWSVMWAQVLIGGPSSIFGLGILYFFMPETRDILFVNSTREAPTA
jgi:uncharacterized membrane protein